MLVVPIPIIIGMASTAHVNIVSGGYDYSTGELIAIVVGLILGIIPGIILLVVLC